LFRQGEPADCLAILASGRLLVIGTDEKGQSIRIGRMVGHTIVGEMGFYRKTPRSATVMAEEPSVVHRLTQEDLDRMHAQDPSAAAVFHQLVIRMLSDRLEFANRETAALV
jgi:SulP family sulfate permease